MSVPNSFAKDLFAVLKSRVAVILCGILSGIITARYLGPAGNGVVATLIVYPDLIMVVGSLGLRQAAAYFVGQKKYDDNHVFSAVLSVWLFTSLLSMILCFLLLKFVTKGNYSYSLIFLAIIPIPFALFNNYSSGFFLGKNKIKEFNTVNWVPNVVKLILYILLIILVPLNVYGALIGIALGYVFLSFFVWKKIRELVVIKWAVHWDIIKNMLRLGLVYAFSLLLISLNYKIDVMFLERLSTSSEVGIYTKGVSIVEYLWEVPTLLSTIIFARSASSTDPKAFSYKVAHLLRICFVIIALMSIVFYFLSEFIMVNMYGTAFLGSATVQKILLPGILLLAIFKILNMDLAGKGKPWYAVIAMLPALIINVILNYLWDAKYGANGSAMASTISYSVSGIIFLIMYSRFVEIPLNQMLRFSYSDFDFLKSIVNKFKTKKAL